MHWFQTFQAFLQTQSTQFWLIQIIKKLQIAKASNTDFPHITFQQFTNFPQIK